MCLLRKPTLSSLFALDKVSGGGQISSFKLLLFFASSTQYGRGQPNDQGTTAIHYLISLSLSLSLCVCVCQWHSYIDAAIATTGGVGPDSGKDDQPLPYCKDSPKETLKKLLYVYLRLK